MARTKVATNGTEEEVKVPVEKSAFADIDKVIAKEFENIIDMSKVDTKVKTWFDTGLYALNYACSKNLFGGIPVGRVTSIDGLTGTGKSMMIASLMRDPRIDYVLLIDTENAAPAELLRFIGVDTKKVGLIRNIKTFENYRINKKDSKVEEINDNNFPVKKETPEFIYVEGVTRIVRRFLNTITFNKVNKNILIVLDTLGNLQSVRELSGTSDMGARSKAIASFFRNFDTEFEKTNVAFVFANKLYTNIGNQWDPWKVAGGVNVEYNPSLSIRLFTTNETYDVTDKEMREEKERRATALGSSLKTLRAKITKSRFGTEYRNATFVVDFATGPIRYSGLFGLCYDFGIITRSGSSYTMEGVFDKSFFKKDFIKLVHETEGALGSIQLALEKAEKDILTKKKTTEVNDLEEVLEEPEENEYADMLNVMKREAENV
jgi:RecA/RadA recombinase